MATEIRDWREQHYRENATKLKIDDSFIGTRIEYLSEFDLVVEGNMKELRWCGVVV